MDSTIKNRYINLQKIFGYLAENGLIDKNEKIDFSKVMHDLYHLNLLIYQTYVIFKKNISKNKKIELLTQLVDGDGNLFIDKDLAKKVIEKYSKSIINFYDSFKDKNTTIINLEDSVNNKNFKGGYINEDFYKNNFINNSLRDIDNVKRTKEIINSPLVNNYLNKFSNINILDIANITYKLGSFAGDVFIYGLNWVFFPLYQLENLPVVGGIISIPLDIIGVMIDNGSIITNFLGPILPTILTIIINIGAAIPIPGVNTFFAGLSTASLIAGKPIQWLLENFLDLLGMFFNISRKQWGLAYLSALELFPIFAKMVDVTVTNLFTINKVLNRGNNFVEGLANSVEVVAPLATTYLFNPSMIFKPMTVFKEVILPRKNKIPILRNLPIEFIFNAPNTWNAINSKIANLDISQNINTSSNKYLKTN